MRFTILNWNIGGAKFLEEKARDARHETRRKLNNALKGIIASRETPPDIITLQEIVRYQEPDDVEIQDIVDPIEGYRYLPFTLIDTNLVSSRAKWNRVLGESDWYKSTYFAQGNAFLVKKNSPVFPVWDLSDLRQPCPATDRTHFVEHVHLDSGLYFGDRNTEPRAALVLHFIYDPESENGDPTLTLDYVFAGPKFVSLDPVIEEKGISDNKVIHDHAFRASDHYPVYSKVEFTPR